MGSLQESINFLAFFLVYIPVNIILMVLAVVIFNVANKIFQLNFPPWVIASAAALFVFVCMAAMLADGFNNNESANTGDVPALFYAAILLINGIVAFSMLIVSGIKNLLFKSAPESSFTFQKPQITATIVYAIITLFVGLQPLLGEGKDYLTDIETASMLEDLKKTIDLNDVEAFKKAFEKNPALWAIKIEGETDVFEYLIAQDKTALVDIVLKHNKALFSYTFDWNVKSAAMIHTLIANGMEPTQAVEIATRENNAAIVQAIISEYRPKFDTLVSAITYNLINRSDTSLLDYLIASGLANNLDQSGQTLSNFAHLNDFNTMKLLVAKGFEVDTAYSSMIYSAIYHNNLPMIKFLFQFPFDVNKLNDEYTNVENAIIGNKEEIFDYLLTLKPDVKTLHTTQLNGATNALLIAEKYKQVAMLEKLKKLK